MDYKPNNGKQRHQKHQGWEFIFLGETPAKPNEGVNQTESSPELVNDRLKMKQAFPLSSTQVGDRVVISQILNGKNMLNRLVGLP
jgi:hypothetical protein